MSEACGTHGKVRNAYRILDGKSEETGQVAPVSKPLSRRHGL
jgi:hypothetical protein